ncbi:UV DNA damage repair endonuclease UvsE [bacterium]|nr:UV DNA damage repair endonuclease UvsE [bacterium]
MNIGYCCISLGCNLGKKKKDQISVNRGMIRKTFDSKGLPYVSELVILNLEDTLKILDWNIRNNIFVYRLSSDSFPWMTEYEFHQLPNFKKIERLLIQIGNKVKLNNIRLSFHPGPYSVLASDNQEVVRKSIIDLERHTQIMDLMQLDRSTFYPINTHINTTKPTCEIAAKRFCDNFNLLSDSLKSRLTVENDDSPNQYSVKMLYDLIHKEISIPIVFDQHHFNYGPQDQTMEEALKLALSTWKTRALTHMSSSRKIEDEKSVSTAHADYIYEKIEDFGLDFDVEIEAKSKDLAVFEYRKKFV